MTTLVIDLSDELISVAAGDEYHLSSIRSSDFWDAPETSNKTLKEFLLQKNIRSPRAILYTLAIKSLNYQVVTLPESIKEREKKVLLGLEIDKGKFSTYFNYKKLDITQREEDGIMLCDYIVLGPKRGVHDKLLAFAKTLNVTTVRATPSFMLFTPRPTERLSASAYLGEDRTEVCIWGAGFPLAVAAIPNTGDQMEDLNRFIAGYFNNIENLELNTIRLYGPKMRDSAQAMSLNYPYELIIDPAHAIAASLSKAPAQMDLLIKTKLPKPPIAITARNLTFVFSALALIGLITYTSLLQSNTLRYERELRNINRKAEHMKLIYAQARKLDAERIEHESERDFYLKITKRRAPWHLIFFDISDLTPRNLWFERFNVTKNNVMIAGKATTPEDVAALSLNLSNSSRYFEDAQVVGMRDFKEGPKTYTEFQLTAKLKSPLKKPDQEPKAETAAKTDKTVKVPAGKVMPKIKSAAR